MTLQDAIRQALERSPELAAAARRAEEAGLGEPLLLANTDPRFESSYARSDDQSPRSAPAFQGSRAQLERWEAGLAQNTLLGTEARLVFRNERLVNPTPFRFLDPSVDARLALELRQPLLRHFWGRPDVARRRRAKAEAVHAQGRLFHARESAAAAAARAYLETYFARGLAAIKAEGVADAKKLLAKYQDKRRYGLVEASDLLQAEASVELQETELLLAQSQVEKTQNALLSALFRAGEPADFPLAAPSGLPPDAAQEPSAALARRGDVRAAHALSESSHWSARIETLDTLPDLALTASYASAGLATAYGRAWNDLSTFDHGVKSAGLSLSIALGRRKELLSRKAARLRAEAAKAELEAVENAARRELRDASIALQLSKKRLAVGRRLAALEEKKFAAEEDNFRRGRSSTDLLLRFQQDIRRSQSELLRAEVDEALARLELARARGRLLEAVGL
jgi:outer membrane protein TolC